MHPVTQDTQEPSWPPEGWLTKKQAAERLGLSESRIAALGGAGIQAEMQRNPNSHQMVTLFHAGSVERFAFERDNPTPSFKTPAKLDKPVDPLTELFQKTGLMSVRGLPRIEAAPQKPWLTVGQAAEYSGLPASAIRSLIDNGIVRKDSNGRPLPPKLPFLSAIDCGPRPGGRYRVKRSDLDALEGTR